MVVFFFLSFFITETDDDNKNNIWLGRRRRQQRHFIIIIITVSHRLIDLPPCLEKKGNAKGLVVGWCDSLWNTTTTTNRSRRFVSSLKDDVDDTNLLPGHKIQLKKTTIGEYSVQ